MGIFHTCNNKEQMDPDDGLYKVSKYLDILQPQFQHFYTPEEYVLTKATFHSVEDCLLGNTYLTRGTSIE